MEVQLTLRGDVEMHTWICLRIMRDLGLGVLFMKINLKCCV